MEEGDPTLTLLAGCAFASLAFAGVFAGAGTTYVGDTTGRANVGGRGWGREVACLPGGGGLLSTTWACGSLRKLKNGK